MEARPIRIASDARVERQLTRWERFTIWLAEQDKRVVRIEMTEEARLAAIAVAIVVGVVIVLVAIIAEHAYSTRQFSQGGYCESLLTARWVKCSGQTLKGEMQ